MKFIKEHILVRTLHDVGDNPRVSILTEPLWFIPYSLFIPFQSIYMRQMGLSSAEIGFIIAFGFFLQIFGSLLGGAITDKWGRRKTTFIFDVISWTIPCILWVIADNFWLFLLAGAINSFSALTHVSWACLFIEDCPPVHVRNAFLIIQICGMLSVFFSPISAWLVSVHGVVVVVRIIYAISALSMTAKFVLLYKYGKETQLGLRRLKETKDISLLSMLADYRSVFLTVIQTKKMMFVVVFISLVNITLIPTTTFFSMYVTETVKLPEEWVAFFPMVRTAIMLLFVFQLHHVVHRISMRMGAVIGLILYITSHVILLLSPTGSFVTVIIYTLLEAVAFSFVQPRKDELMVLYVDEKNRSRIFAIYMMAMLGITAPFGIIFGRLYEIGSGYPFIVNILLFLTATILILSSKDLKKHEQTIGDGTDV